MRVCVCLCVCVIFAALILCRLRAAGNSHPDPGCFYAQSFGAQLDSYTHTHTKCAANMPQYTLSMCDVLEQRGKIPDDSDANVVDTRDPRRNQECRPQRRRIDRTSATDLFIFSNMKSPDPAATPITGLRIMSNVLNPSHAGGTFRISAFVVVGSLA